MTFLYYQGRVRDVGIGDRERYSDRCGGLWKDEYELIVLHSDTCLYGGCSFRGVRLRLQKLPSCLSQTISTPQANFLALPSTAAGGLEKVYWHGTPCTQPASRTIQNGLTAQLVFRANMAPAELGLISQLKDSLLYQFYLIDETKKCRQPSLSSSRLEDILDKQNFHRALPIVKTSHHRTLFLILNNQLLCCFARVQEIPGLYIPPLHLKNCRVYTLEGRKGKTMNCRKSKSTIRKDKKT